MQQKKNKKKWRNGPDEEICFKIFLKVHNDNFWQRLIQVRK